MSYIDPKNLLEELIYVGFSPQEANEAMRVIIRHEASNRIAVDVEYREGYEKFRQSFVSLGK